MNKFYLLLLCCVILFKASAQPGSLDHTFGNKGIQTTAIFSDANLLDEYGRAVLTSANGDVFVAVSVSDWRSTYTRIAKYLPDGRLDSSYGNAGYSDAVKLGVNCAAFQGDKIIVAGEGNFYNSDFTLARYTADGALDSSFGVNGRVKTDFNGSKDDYVYAIVLQGDKIIAAGYTVSLTNPGVNDNFALARYTADGKLDSSFGENGRVITDCNSYYDQANSIALQGDKIIVGGTALVRYTADGALDSTFGMNGIATPDFRINSIVMQGDKITAGGFSGNYDFALARFTAEGALDSTFGKNGKVKTGIGSFEAYPIALQGDKIIAAGYTNSHDTKHDFALVRFTADGKLDSTFGKNGTVTTDFNNANDVANAIVLQGDKIIQAGYSADNVNVTSDFALARYTDDGKLDASFGVNGKLTGHFPSSHTFFTGAAIQGNKIVAAGYARGDNRDNFVLARYTAEGTPDSSFGENGKVITDFNNHSYYYASPMVLQGDKIILAGYTYTYSVNGGTPDFALARYTADGKLDSTFGENGIVKTDIDYSNDYANSVALQGDKIIVAGNAHYADGDDFALARYTTDGVLDSTFGKNGRVTTDFNSDYESAFSIALQGNKIVVAGYTYNAVNYHSNFALVRYTDDGMLDTSFGENGKITTDLVIVYSIALQGDKIIAAGYTYNADTKGDFALLRYSADGVLDSTFGENGIVTTDFNNLGDYANAVALSGDKIIIGGSSYNSFSSYDFALARYTANGGLDSSFGVNGKVITHLHHSSSISTIALYQNRLYAVGYNSQFDGDYGMIAAYQLETPEPTISIADVTVSESKKFAVVTVRLSKPANKLVRVHFTTRDKTAVHNEDYLPISGPLFFVPGVNNIAKIFIPLIDDNQTKGDKQFEINLSDAHNATIQDSIGVVTIVDDDNAPIAKQNTSLHMNVSPNPSANVFTVQIQGSNLKQPISVRVYDVSGRMIEQRNNVSIGQSLHLGEQYKAGTYIIEAVQGSQKLQTKVIKTGQ